MVFKADTPFRTSYINIITQILGKEKLCFCIIGKPCKIPEYFIALRTDFYFVTIFHKLLQVDKA